MLVVEPLGMPTRHPQQAGHSFFGHVHKTGRGPHATAFTQMADDILHGGLVELGIEQGRATSFRKRFSAATTT
jgi:hypothetical protein